jgi:hypothetical protein
MTRKKLPSDFKRGHKAIRTSLEHGKAICTFLDASVTLTPFLLQPRKSPKIKLKLRAPIELENLLPYNIQYRIYDKNADQNWKSYLRKGGVMPVHSVELGHLVLLNVEVQDTSESNGSSEYVRSL